MLFYLFWFPFHNILWWRRLLRVPWTAKRTNLSNLKEINPDCSLEGQILKLRLQDFGHLMRRENSCWERVKVRGERDDRGWDGWTVSPKPPPWFWPNSGRQWKTGGPGVLWSMGVTKRQTWLNDQTTTKAFEEGLHREVICQCKTTCMLLLS